MLKIRLQRVGRKHETAFRLVLTDSKNSTKSGRFKEILGSYDPRKATDLIKTDRVKHWIEKGVLLSDSVHNLFVNHKVIDAKKKNVLPKKTFTPPAVEAAPEAEAKAEETPVETAPVVSDEPAPAEAVAEPIVEETPVEATLESTPEESAPVVESTEAE
jgi:small subunit ribosomal protein S16